MYRIKQYLWNLFVNGILMSYLVPVKIRTLIMNSIGCNIKGVVHGHTTMLTNRLILGEGSYINRNCTNDNAGADIIIGNNCSIACGVSIHTTNHITNDPSKRGGVISPKPVVIKDGSWIGSGSIILPGTIIEKGVVIAAGSVVRKTCEQNCLYAGNPAIKIKILNNETKRIV